MFSDKVIFSVLFASLLNAFILPQGIKLWQRQIEISFKSLTLTEGSEFKVTCDGSVVGSRIDPHLRWYGPDKHWIAYEGPHSR